MNSEVIGLDLSLTATGMAVGQTGSLLESRTISGTRDGLYRMEGLHNSIIAPVDYRKPTLTVMEDFSFGSSGGKAAERIGLAYLVRMWLYKRGHPFVCVAPSSLKKFICGRGGGPKNQVTKDQVLKEMYKNFNHDVNDHNQADAIGLCYIGMALIGEWEPRTVAQRDVLAAIKKKEPWLSTRGQVVS